MDLEASLLLGSCSFLFFSVLLVFMEREFLTWIKQKKGTLVKCLTLPLK